MAMMGICLRFLQTLPFPLRNHITVSFYFFLFFREFVNFRNFLILHKNCASISVLVHCESDKLPVQITSNNGIGAGASSSPISSGSSSSSTSEDLTANSNEDKNFESNGQHHTAKPFSNQPPVISKDVGLLKVYLHVSVNLHYEYDHVHTLYCTLLIQFNLIVQRTKMNFRLKVNCNDFNCCDIGD